jgi:hypothetical protein
MLHESLLVVLLSTAPAAPGPATVREELHPLQFLVGHCWTASFPDGQSTDTHCFDSVYGGHFVRDRHVVRGAKKPYEGETLYAWDAQKQVLVYTYWNSDGGISTGTAAPAGEDGLSFREEHAAKDAAMELKTVWTRRGDDGYDARTLRKKDGQWQEFFKMSFHRDDTAHAEAAGGTKAGEP